jgi:hypothetical protein
VNDRGAPLWLFLGMAARARFPKYELHGKSFHDFQSTTTWGWPAKALYWIEAAIILVPLVHAWWMTAAVKFQSV